MQLCGSLNIPCLSLELDLTPILNPFDIVPLQRSQVIFFIFYPGFLIVISRRDRL